MYSSFLELAEQRYSAGKYFDKPIKRGKVERILHVGQVAPSAMNARP